MLREILKQEIDNLDEEQLIKLAEYFSLIKLSTKQKQKQNSTGINIAQKKAEDFMIWVTQLPQNNGFSLDDEAFNRENIY